MRARHFLAGLVLMAAAARAQEDAAELFERRVRPLLTARCYACHATTQSGGLRVDSRAALLAGGKSGPAIAPGKPRDSLLIRVVSGAEAPMPKTGAKLSEREVADFSS